jgi:hypothetical protein
MNGELAGINVWLGILALVSLAEFLMIVVAGVVGFRLYRRVSALVDRAESAYLAPLTQKANLIVDEAQQLVARAQRLEARARTMLGRAEEMAGRVGSVAQHAWPVLGTWRAVAAALQSLRGNGEARHGTRYEYRH